MFESSSSTFQSLIFKSSRKLRCDIGAEISKIEDNIEEEPADALQEEEDDIDDIEIDRITPE